MVKGLALDTAHVLGVRINYTNTTGGMVGRINVPPGYVLGSHDQRLVIQGITSDEFWAAAFARLQFASPVTRCKVQACPRCCNEPALKLTNGRQRVMQWSCEQGYVA